jgi:hypothetical protein
MDSDHRIRAYLAIDATIGEPIEIEWPPGRFGHRRTTRSSGPVLAIYDPADKHYELVLAERLARTVGT